MSSLRFLRHPEGNSPKDLQTQNHVITRNNIEQEVQKSTQSDVVIPNKLSNCETCHGLLRHFVLLPDTSPRHKRDSVSAKYVLRTAYRFGRQLRTLLGSSSQ